MLRTVEIVQGKPAPDCSRHDLTSANARKTVVQKRLGELRRGDDETSEEREALIAENFALERHIRGLREEKKRDQMRRAFAGIGSPLHEALLDLHADLVPTLEGLAMKKLGERERRAAERKAQKSA